MLIVIQVIYSVALLIYIVLNATEYIEKENKLPVELLIVTVLYMIAETVEFIKGGV